MRQGNRQRHICAFEIRFGFIGSIAKHHTLIASAGGSQLILVPILSFLRLVYPHSNISGLTAQGNKNPAVIAVEPIIGIGISDIINGLTD